MSQVVEKVAQALAKRIQMVRPAPNGQVYIDGLLPADWFSRNIETSVPPLAQQKLIARIRELKAA